MSRISLLVAVAVAAGVVGCAQCDTCDDFPVPCTGPNCGQLMPGGVPGYFGDNMPSQGDTVMGASAPTTYSTASDSAGPAPPTPTPTPTPVDPTSPPPPMDPSARPN